MDNLRARAVGPEGAEQPPTRIEGLLDVNLLPERYQRARLKWSSVLAWLALIVLIGLLVPSYQRWQISSEKLNVERLALVQAQSDMESIDPDAEARAKLQEQIDTALSRAADLRTAASAISIQDVEWGSTIGSIRAAQVNDLRLTGILVDGGTVQLNGDAKSYSLPLDYAAALRSTGDFQSVVVESISKVELSPEQQAEVSGAAIPAPAEEGSPIPSGGEPVIRYSFEISVLVKAPDTTVGEVANEAQ
jgi:hypothetical protein